MLRTTSVLLLLLFSCLYSQSEFIVNSKVVSATVFRNRALVTRQGGINLPKGISKVIISNLPIDLLDETIRATATGSGTVKILEIKIESKNSYEIQQSEVKRISQKIDSLTNLINDKEDKLTVLNYKRGIIESIHAESPRFIAEKTTKLTTSPQDWEKITSYIESNLKDMYGSISGINEEKKKYENEITVLRLNLGELKAGVIKKYKEISIMLELERAGDIQINPSYLTTSTSWYPIYDARVYPAQNNVELSYYGMVQQATGENWENINLTLSTANPAQGNTIPEPVKWEIGSANTDMKVRGGRSGEQNYIVQSEPQIKNTPLSTSFVIQSAVTLPSDNSTHQVIIAVKKVPTQLNYSATPKITPGVYLSGKVVNTFDFPLLEGEMNVYVDNDFINKSSCKTIVQNDTLNISLGTDEKLKADKKLISRKYESAGLFGGSRRVLYSFEIQLANNRTSPVEIELIDQIPTSLHEDITVELTEPVRTPDELGSDKKITWHLVLQSGERKSIPVQYQVTLPKSIQLYGME